MEVSMNSRTKNSILTMALSSTRQVITLLLTFLSRTVFIYVLGAEYLGLNGLFSNILSLLALSDLGIASAITFYLYKPLACNNVESIKSLMAFYKTCYRAIGSFFIMAGVLIMPFLPKLVNFNQGIPVNLYLVYFLCLINSASSYLFFAYKQTLIIANQEQYKIEKINILFSFLNCITDIVVLICCRDYILYLSFKLVLTLVKNIVIARKVDNEYPYIKEKHYKKLSKNEINDIFKDVYNVAVFRIGHVFFTATDNLIISSILGTIIVGYYSNYHLVISQITVFITLIVNSVYAGVGNVIAKEDSKKQFELFKQLDFFVYFITAFCSVCLFQLLNSFINIWVGSAEKNYILSQMVVILNCFVFYLDNSTQIVNVFRESSGHFELGRNTEICGGVLNIILSIIFSKIWGLPGVFFATVVSKMLLVIIPLRIWVGKTVFNKSYGTILYPFIIRTILTGVVCTVTWLLLRGIHQTTITNFVFETIFTAIISLILLILIYLPTNEMKSLIGRVKGWLVFSNLE